MEGGKALMFNILFSTLQCILYIIWKEHVQTVWKANIRTNVEIILLKWIEENKKKRYFLLVCGSFPFDGNNFCNVTTITSE